MKLLKHIKLRHANINEYSLAMDNLNEGVFIGQNYDSYGHIINISRKQNTGLIWLW